MRTRVVGTALALLLAACSPTLPMAITVPSRGAAPLANRATVVTAGVGGGGEGLVFGSGGVGGTVEVEHQFHDGALGAQVAGGGKDPSDGHESYWPNWLVAARLTGQMNLGVPWAALRLGLGGGMMDRGVRYGTGDATLLVSHRFRWIPSYRSTWLEPFVGVTAASTKMLATSLRLDTAGDRLTPGEWAVFAGPCFGLRGGADRVWGSLAMSWDIPVAGPGPDDVGLVTLARIGFAL